MEKELETIPEFCWRHSVSRTAFYGLVRDGRIRITKVGRRSLVARADSEAFRESLRETATTQ